MSHLDEYYQIRLFETLSLAAHTEWERVTALKEESLRPSTLYKPALSIDGDQWCALYGEDLQCGVAGFGDSPTDAYRDFDRAWFVALPMKGGGR